ncbi:hypothetical protein Tco_0991357 [Tanacetum coccineum]|uniref:Reverse transcriptase domain-containing protein n=1 Tax=Tanacetum coccineum TaxID=301880 RepID=A0ABQ5EZU1_9ASTR
MKRSSRHGTDFNDLYAGHAHTWISELHQLDTFYNALNSNDQDSLNSAAAYMVRFWIKIPMFCLRIIETKSKVRNSRNKPVVAKVSSSTSTPGISPDVAELKDMVKALLLDKKTQAPAPVKAVEECCVTCGGTHSYRNCPATDGNVYRDNIQEYVSQAAAANYNQGNTSYRAPIANQIRPPSFPPVQNQGNNQNRYNQNRGNNYNQGQIYRPPINQPPVHQAPPYKAPAPQTQALSLVIPLLTRSSGNVETEVTKDTVPPTNNGSTKDVQLPVVQVQTQVPKSEPVAITLLVYDPIVYTSSPTLNTLRDSDFPILRIVDAFLALEDDPTSPEVDDSYYDPEGDIILLLEAFLNDDPSYTPSHSKDTICLKFKKN